MYFSRRREVFCNWGRKTYCSSFFCRTLLSTVQQSPPAQPHIYCFLEIVPVIFSHTRNQHVYFPTVRLKEQLTLLPKTLKLFQILLLKFCCRALCWFCITKASASILCSRGILLRENLFSWFGEA